MTTAPVSDGIDGYSDETTGQAGKKKGGLIRGTTLKFGNTAEWETKDGEVICPETRLILTDVARVVTKWKDKRPAETVVLEPGEPWPDVEEWNDQVPRSEWIDGPGGKKGPWQAQQIVYLLDPKTMAQYSFPSGTVGGSIAIREAIDSTKAMRRFRPGACPIVELSSKYMNTAYGGRQRPHMIIHDWVQMGGAEPQPAALPAPETVKSKSFVVGDGVKPVTFHEEVGDSVPF